MHGNMRRFGNLGALRRRGFFAWLALLTVLLVWGTLPVHAAVRELIQDGQTCGTVPVRDDGSSLMMALDVAAGLLSAHGTIQNGEFSAVLGDHQLRVVNGAAMAWTDFDIVAMPRTSVIDEEHCWVDADSGLRVLKNLLRKNKLPFALSWGKTKNVPDQSVPPPAADQTPHTPTGPTDGRKDAVRGAAPAPAPAGPSKQTSSKVSNIRWGRAGTGIRMVVDVEGSSSPDVQLSDGQMTATFAQATDRAVRAAKLAEPGVTVLLICGKEASLEVRFAGRTGRYFWLDNPKRLVLDIGSAQPSNKTQSTAETSPNSGKGKKAAVPSVAGSGATAGVSTGGAVSEGGPAKEAEAQDSDSVESVSASINRSAGRKTPVIPQQIQRPRPSHLPKPKRARPLVVVDPGHGGKDPGAMRGAYKEKIIALQIATRLKTELNKLGIDVQMTRTGDTYPTLSERPALANSLNASAFVSIHLNSVASKTNSTQGQEIYIMALPTDKDAMKLARIENADIMDNGKASADSRTDMLMTILGNMQQNAKISESTNLAEALYASGGQNGIIMRRVAQAPFAVLRGAAMPAVLIETGFITNPAEVKRLASAAYQQKIAVSVAKGLQQYFKDHPDQ